VADDQGKLGVGQLAVNYMQVGAAHAAGQHLKQNLVVRGFRHGAFAE